MKNSKNKKIALNEILVNCITCNTSLKINTVLKKDLKVDVCSHCHPFYLGTQKFESKAGRMERFRQLERKTALLQEKRKNQTSSIEKNLTKQNSTTNASQ